MKSLSELGVSQKPWRVIKASLQMFRIRDEPLREPIVKPTILASFKEGVGCVNVVDAVYELPDARLIAAAPELYEALRELVEWCDYDYMSQVENYKPMIEKAKAALAKASGEPVNDRVNDRVNKEAKQ